MTNQVKLQFFDKSNGMGALVVNTSSFLSTNFNPSNPIRLEAAMIKLHPIYSTVEIIK